MNYSGEHVHWNVAMITMKKMKKGLVNNPLKNVSPKLKKIIGVVKLPFDFDDKKALRDAKEEKYL